MSFAMWSVRMGFAALVLAACGDKPSDNGENAPNKPYGAAADGTIGNSDPDTSVADLNSAEWKAACLDIGRAGGAREFAHSQCIVPALLATFVGLDCMGTYELCLEEPESEQCDSKPTDCTATLRQLDDCSVSQLVWLAEQTRDIDCSSSLNSIISIAQDHTTPECDAIKAICPSFETAASSSDDFSDF